MNQKLSTQRLYALAILLVLVVVASALVLTRAFDIGRQIEMMKGTRIPAVLAVNTVDVKLMKARSDVRRVLLFVADGKTEAARTYRQKVDEDWEEIDGAFAPLPGLSRGFVVEAHKDRVARMAIELPALRQEQTGIVAEAIAAGPAHIAHE